MTTSTLNPSRGSEENHHIYGTWLALMALTALSWWLGAEHGFDSRNLVAVIVLVVAFAKVYVVGHSFMELRNAAPALRRIYAAWCVVVCTTVAGLYLAS